MRVRVTTIASFLMALCGATLLLALPLQAQNPVTAAGSPRSISNEAVVRTQTASDDASMFSAILATKRSIARIETIFDGKLYYGNGFVVSHPNDANTKFIVTAAHVHPGGSHVQAIFDNGSGVVPCRPIACNDQLDLMLLEPLKSLSNVTALKFLTTEGSYPKEGDKIWAFGCTATESRPPYISNYAGHVSGEPRKFGAIWPKLSKSLGAKAFLHHDTVVFEFQAPSLPGMSGGPLVNQDGLVVGVHSHRLTSESHAGYAVIGTCIESTLQEPVTDASLKAIAERISLPPDLGTLEPTSTKPLWLSRGNHQFNGNSMRYSIHHRLAISMVRDIHNPAMQLFQHSQKLGDLETFVAALRPSVVENKAYGVRMLVPEAYAIETIQAVQAAQTGIAVDIRPEAQKRSIGNLRIYAFTIDRTFRESSRYVDELIANPQNPIVQIIRKPREKLLKYREMKTNAESADRILESFANSVLHITIRNIHGEVIGNPTKEVFRQHAEPVDDLSNGRAHWSTVEYVSESGATSYSIRCGAQGNRCIVVQRHYQSNDQRNLLDGIPTTAPFVEQLFVDATVDFVD